MGSAVGVCLGLALGTYHIFRYGAGPRGFISTLGQYMATSAGSFALFMGVGSAIRSEEQPKNIMWKQHLERQNSLSRGFANLPVEVLEGKRWDRKIVGM
ncbi:reactive mitochondrial oxygen species modulator 1-domain-containing protein [Rhizophagus irregularis DAOM 181602=DAOM 197198]|nr:reactive mitochondrial oxygen species modulator 1-domain-containing protein [Rhizophagus irregularis DAOM 181602=DAOM 197198]